MSRVPYLSVVGSLMYAIVSFHPDLSHALSMDFLFICHSRFITIIISTILLLFPRLSKCPKKIKRNNVEPEKKG